MHLSCLNLTSGHEPSTTRRVCESQGKHGAEAGKPRKNPPTFHLLGPSSDAYMTVQSFSVPEVLSRACLSRSGGAQTSAVWGVGLQLVYALAHSGLVFR